MNEGPTKPVKPEKASIPAPERHTPPGYDSIPPEMWLNPNYQSKDHDSWYGENNLNGMEFFEIITRTKTRHDGHLDILARDYMVRPFELMRSSISITLLETDFASRVEKGEYGLIFGEDSSARIPTLFLKEVVQRLCSTSDVQAPTVCFYAGLTDDLSGWKDQQGRTEGERHISREYQMKKASWKKKMREYINRLGDMYLTGPNQKKRILLCTEQISSGGSIKNIEEVLVECGYDCDLIALSVYETSRGFKKDFSQKHKTFYGVSEKGFDNSIRGNYWMSGVFKESGDIHAQSAKKSLKHNGPEVAAQKYGTAANLSQIMTMQEAMKTSRAMAKYVGANVAQAYLDYEAGKFTLPEWMTKKDGE